MLISDYGQAEKKKPSMNHFLFKENFCFLISIIAFEKSFPFMQMLSYLYFILLVTVLLSA